MYSDKLASKGKFFEKGFYKGAVEKIVFMASPLLGSDLAVASIASPLGAMAMRGIFCTVAKIHLKT